MILKLIKVGVKNLLKIICEKILIKEIQIFNKNDKFNGIIDELYIKAESIIFNKININNVNINIRDLVLKFAFNKEIFFIETCYAAILLRLTSENINKTLLSNKWERLKISIESFISMRFKSIEIKNKSIYFIPSNGLSNKSVDYILEYDNNSICLVNNVSQEKLSILNDKNININNLFFSENFIELELSSQIIFN
tara:strand:+ start:130 stop:717 length:588 start_codon:yes stop_codon:yes gene_type:complete